MGVVLVHGSVETSCESPYISALQEAALTGHRSLESGIVDAVEKAVMVLENNPLFNAGYGSVLNLDGEAEMDAAIMDGVHKTCGAVAAIKSVKNPVCVARGVMERTPHTILAGEGAQRLAREMGFGPFDPVTAVQRESWRKAMSLRSEKKDLPYSAFTGLPTACDTVGCVVMHQGRTAAASSTGGSFLKLPGRVGDTPIFGGGIYASSEGAVVCTGLGEAFIRLNLAGQTLSLIARGVSVLDAAVQAVGQVSELNATGGLLVVDKDGNAAAAHNADSFPVALVIDGEVVRDFQPVKI